jgi:hypothetical protein
MVHPTDRRHGLRDPDLGEVVRPSSELRTLPAPHETTSGPVFALHLVQMDEPTAQVTSPRVGVAGEGATHHLVRHARHGLSPRRSAGRPLHHRARAG